jgi:hypothetical protein
MKVFYFDKSYKNKPSNYKLFIQMKSEDFIYIRFKNFFLQKSKINKISYCDYCNKNRPKKSVDFFIATFLISVLHWQ